MDDMLKDFVVEAMDLAVNVEEHLLRLERDPDNKETLNAVFRSFHTIKGGAGFMGLPALVAACHLTENLFDALRTGAAPVTPIAIEAALQASGFVADQLTELANGAAPESLPAMPEELEHILTNAIEGKGMDAHAPAAAVVAEVAVVVAEVVVAAPAAAAVSTATVSADGLDWEGMYNAVVPAGSQVSAAPASVVAAAPAAVAQDGHGAHNGQGHAHVRAHAGFQSDRIRVTVDGDMDGRDIILIPGLSSSPAVWQGTVDHLNGAYRVHRIHVQGFAGAPAEGNASGPVAAPGAEEIAR